MKFTKLESIMSTLGVNSLAEIARKLDTTPQAVSNWKARDQVPYHIVTKLNLISNDNNISPSSANFISEGVAEDSISITKIFLILAQQLKIIILLPIVFMFFTFTYVKFVQQPQFRSTATVLLPNSQSGSMGGLAGLASQFGVNIPSGSGSAQADLSSPLLIPELLRSRTFVETLLSEKFYINIYKKELSLLAIMNGGIDPPADKREVLITEIFPDINDMINFTSGGSFSQISVVAFEPLFAKELSDAVLKNIAIMNSNFRSQSLKEKTLFIENRIKVVERDLKDAELKYKLFLEQNRQVISPSLQLDQERISRDVEIQKEIYLTLKQQLELAQIEQIEEASIIKILDKPQLPLYPFNIKLKTSLLISLFAGIAFGILLGFIRAYPDNVNIKERKTMRSIRNFIKKKGKDFINDYRIWGILSLSLTICFPIYLSHKSSSPVYFGMYSKQLLLLLIFYIIALIFCIIMFSRFHKINKKS